MTKPILLIGLDAHCGVQCLCELSEVTSELSQVQYYLTEYVFSGIASCF
jgi:hypothetical protein